VRKPPADPFAQPAAYIVADDSPASINVSIGAAQPYTAAASPKQKKKAKGKKSLPPTPETAAPPPPPRRSFKASEAPSSLPQDQGEEQYMAPRPAGDDDEDTYLAPTATAPKQRPCDECKVNKTTGDTDPTNGLWYCTQCWEKYNVDPPTNAANAGATKNTTNGVPGAKDAKKKAPPGSSKPAKKSGAELGAATTNLSAKGLYDRPPVLTMAKAKKGSKAAAAVGPSVDLLGAGSTNLSADGDLYSMPPVQTMVKAKKGGKAAALDSDDPDDTYAYTPVIKSSASKGKGKGEGKGKGKGKGNASQGPESSQPYGSYTTETIVVPYGGDGKLGVAFVGPDEDAAKDGVYVHMCRPGAPAEVRRVPFRSKHSSLPLPLCIVHGIALRILPCCPLATCAAPAHKAVAKVAL